MRHFHDGQQPASAGKAIDTNTKVHVREDVLTEADGPMLRYGLQEVHGARLILPRNVADKPNRDFLAIRFEEFRAA